MSEELKPCPFCGSKYRIRGDGTFACSKKNCPLKYIGFTKEEWQSRPLEDALQEKINADWKIYWQFQNELAELLESKETEEIGYATVRMAAENIIAERNALREQLVLEEARQRGGEFIPLDELLNKYQGDVG